MAQPTVKEKKAEAKRILSGYNPIEPTNSQNTRAFLLIEASKFLAKELIDKDPLHIMTYDYYYGGDFGYATPSDNPNWISADEATARYRASNLESSYWTGGGNASASQDANDDDMSRIRVSNPSPMQLTYIYRNSQWPAWTD